MANLPPLKLESNLRGTAVSSISLVTFTIGTNLVLLLIYVCTKRHILGRDDCTVCVASLTLSSSLNSAYLLKWILSLLGTVVNVYQVANGAIRHSQPLAPTPLSAFIKWPFVEGVEFVIGKCFVKVSVCIFILRFINKARRFMRYFTYLLMDFLITLLYTVREFLIIHE